MINRTQDGLAPARGIVFGIIAATVIYLLGYVVIVWLGTLL